MNDQSLQQNGFTLVELLVATLIFNIIITAIYKVRGILLSMETHMICILYDNIMSNLYHL